MTALVPKVPPRSPRTSRSSSSSRTSETAAIDRAIAQDRPFRKEGKRRWHGRGRRGISTAHLAVLITGLFTTVSGVVLLLGNGSVFAPSEIVLTLLGAFLVLLGVAETFVEERRAGGGHR